MHPMRRKVLLAAAILVGTAGFVALSWRHRESGVQAATIRSRRIDNAQGSNATPESRPRSNSLDESTSRYSPQLEAEGASEPKAEKKLRASEPPVETVSKNQEPSAWELLDAESAIGRPFPMSPSVMRTCVSLEPTKSECRYLAQFMKDFAREPRDLAWAREVEEELEKATSLLDANRFSVRAIECRKTLCMLEVATLDAEAYLGHFEKGSMLDELLVAPVAGDLGFEKGPNGERIIVTVGGYRRQDQ